MPNLKQCPECGTEKALVLRMYQHVTSVGGVRVVDTTTQRWQCSACGEVDLTLNAMAAYERRAAALVLRDGRHTGGAVIRFARKALGLTQAELALLLGCQPETLSRWENDKGEMPRAEQLAVVALLDGVEASRVDLQEALAQARGDGRKSVPEELSIQPLEPRSASG